jgi:hypothetical protein
MGRDAAKTSPDALACTTTHAPYDATISGQHFRLWDTAGMYSFMLKVLAQSGSMIVSSGLNEGSEGTVPAVMAERNLTAFLRGLNQENGVHLLLYCVRGTRATKALQTHYKIFSAVIRDSKVPTIIVVTCLEESCDGRVVEREQGRACNVWNAILWICLRHHFEG